MAKVIARHDIETDITLPWDEETKQYEAGIEKAREHMKENVLCAGHPIGSGKLVGETIQFQIADGYAVYMVANENPLNLLHINYGDGYQIPDAHARGLNLTEIRRMVKSEKAMNKLFGG